MNVKARVGLSKVQGNMGGEVLLVGPQASNLVEWKK